MSVATSNSGETIIQKSEALRAKRYYREAIALIESNIESIPLECHANAWFEAFYAARDKGDTELARKYILAIVEADPQVLASD